ncbi:MAG: TetR/AcrR family transcriptional regulator [Pseudomonadales bacterium]|nr:TetR/AcrR family transcriptional regulator [Pseudomonadales bacterium]
MSKSLWSANRPKSEVEAKERLCDAALACIKRNGFDRTTMSDIAKQAGVARPTLYKHFKSKTEIFFAAIDGVALSFTEAVVEHAMQFVSFEERVTETIIFVVTELPQHPSLSLVLNNECAQVLRNRAFFDDATLIFSQMTAGPLIDVRPELKDQGVEITEIMSRFSLSLILFPGRYLNDLDGLRALIKKRLLPGLI